MQNTAEKRDENSPLHRFTSSSIYAEENVEESGKGRKRLIIAIVALSAFLGLLAFSYNKSRQSGGEAVIATVEPKTPYTRIRPDTPQGAGNETQLGDMEIYDRANGATGKTQQVEKLAPLPEQPIIKTAEEKSGKPSLAEIANANEEKAIEAANAATPATPVDEAKTVLQNAAAGASKAGVVALPLNIKQTDTAVASNKNSARAVVEESDESSQATEDEAPAVLTQKPAAVVKKPIVVQATPAVKPTPVTVVPLPKQTVKKVEKKAVAPVVAEKPQQAAQTVRVQLGAFSSESLAQNAWKTLSAKNSAVLGSLNPRVVSVDVNGKTFYRLQAGTLASKSAADAVCSKLKAVNQTCIVAK